MKVISFKDFNEEYMQPKERWDFSLFKIRCNKCGSENVEYAGQIEIEYAYYGDFDAENKVIVKCHDCGNALAMKNTEGGTASYCDCDCGY